MGKRRMFSKDIVRSDSFLDLPVSSRELYFQLGMDTDDRGYISNAKSVIRLIGANQGDLEPLIIKGFVMLRGEALLLQKHFKINNVIRSDRFTETTYVEDLKKLFIEDNGAYTEDATKGKKMVVDTIGIPNDNQMTTQDKLSKVNLSNILDKHDKYNSEQVEIVPNEFSKRLISYGYITAEDLEIESYNKLYDFIKLANYSDQQIYTVMKYIIDCIKFNHTQIINKYAYLKTAMTQGLTYINQAPLDLENQIERMITQLNDMQSN